MFDLDSVMREFYNDEIAVSEKTREVLRKARAANEERLERGLARNDGPKVKRHVRQGSYAMKTMVQQPENHYDIDNGALLERAAMSGTSSAEARTLVCKALQDESFNTEPEVRTNCVRVYYNEGYWVDIPRLSRMRRFQNRPGIFGARVHRLEALRTRARDPLVSRIRTPGELRWEFKR